MDLITELARQRQTNAVNSAMIEERTFHYRWLGIGVLELTPKVSQIESAVIISAGIHGNETAPIELLNGLVHEIFAGTLPLKVALLVILGNPEAIETGKRYLNADMNRMFSGKSAQFAPSSETQRAQFLEAVVTQFYQAYPKCIKAHFDMHTAIRASHYGKFVLLPFQMKAYHKRLLAFFMEAKLDAVVFHNAAGGTFSQFTTTQFEAASCTLELGKARPFGQNDLSLYLATLQALRNIISVSSFDNLPSETLDETNTQMNQVQPSSEIANQLDFFQVQISLLKQDEASFKLHVKDDCPNFTVFYQGDCLLEQAIEGNATRYCVTHEKEWILFPNPKVALGLRAAILLTQMDAELAQAKFD